MGKKIILSVDDLLTIPYPFSLQVGDSISSWVTFDGAEFQYWYNNCFVYSVKADSGDKIMIEEGVSVIKMQKPKNPILAEFWKRNFWRGKQKEKLLDVVKEAYERTRFDKVFRREIPLGVCYVSKDSRIAVYYYFDYHYGTVSGSWYFHGDCTLDEIKSFFALVDENGVYPCSFMFDAIRVVTEKGLLSRRDDYKDLPTWFLLLTSSQF